MKKTAYDKAVGRVKRIKGFYNHLFIYIIFLVLWVIFAGNFFSSLGGNYGQPDKGFFDWVNINLWLNPLIWGVIVLIHAISVFGMKSALFKRWEEKKIQEYMNEEKNDTYNRYE